MYVLQGAARARSELQVLQITRRTEENHMPMTITEALAEIKTIGKRIEKKRQAVLQNIGRDSRLKDPLEDSVKYLREERQAIEDLEKRIVTIRAAIHRKNLETNCTVGENTMPVQEWLEFRREVAPGRQMFLTSINAGVRQIRDKIQAQGGRVSFAAAAAVAQVNDGEKKPPELLLHLDEKKLLEEQEGLEKVLGDLDGKLSLLNATTVIDV